MIEHGWQIEVKRLGDEAKQWERVQIPASSPLYGVEMSTGEVKINGDRKY